LLLGVQGIPLIFPLLLFWKRNIVANVGGIEWERPKFNFLAKAYLRLCFNLSLKYANTVILDNEHYNIYLPKKYKATIRVIPYGGEIDSSLEITDKLKIKYPFLNQKYFLSISRALEDNQIDKLCESFVESKELLVLISNFSSSKFGETVYNKYKNFQNIHLINGLYIKEELDLIRRKCYAYIHTHTLCGTAPSLVEMIIARRPILSFDIPQNRYTLRNEGYFFKSFNELQEIIKLNNNLSIFIPSEKLPSFYSWEKIILQYESNY
jgi:hypothetical protein